MFRFLILRIPSFGREVNIGVLVSWWLVLIRRIHHQVSMILRLATANENLLLERHLWARIPGVQS